MTIELRGPRLAVDTCAQRLRAIGSDGEAGSPGPADSGRGAQRVLGVSDVLAGSGHEISCDISWHGPAGLPPDRLATEATVQAMSGLMHLHGLEAGRPRRLGLEVSTVAAGVLASQAVLASILAQRRGHRVRSVETSVLQAALLSVSQYFARATCSRRWGEWTSVEPGPAPGPPFPTADGQWVELETTSLDAWTLFWGSLGVDPAVLGRGWGMFAVRYSTATCSMPHGFHDATLQVTAAGLTDLAERCGMSLCALRQYDEVLKQPGLASMGRPLIRSGNDPGGATGQGGARSALRSPGNWGRTERPLEGIRVVEATSRVQGPLAGMLLRALGADVVRVEPPGGDVARMEDPIAGDTGAFFLSMNRGKQPIEIDLARPAGRAELVELVASADAFLHNWRPGKAADWGLDAPDLAAVNPRLVYAQASGWGALAASCPRVGMEFMVQAYAGMGQGMNPEGSPPFPTRLLLSDFFGGLVACEAILGALYRREMSGRGAAVHTSLLDGAMTLQAHVLEPLAVGREEGRRQGRPVWGPLDQAIATGDGFLALTVVGTEDLRRLCEVCDVDARTASTPTVEALVVERLAEDTASAWERRLVEASVPCAVVQADLAALPADPRFSNLFEPLGGPALAPGHPWALS